MQKQRQNNEMQKGRCDGCKNMYTREAFNNSIWHNGRKSGRKLICLACAERGQSLYDLALYTCNRCGLSYGHLKFNKNHRNNCKRKERETKYICTDCAISVRQQLEKEAEARAAKTIAHNEKNEERRILAILREPEAWRCNCKKICIGQRAYAALHNQVHTERCQLFPTMMGEKRWDGKNKGVTLQHLIFLHRRTTY